MFSRAISDQFHRMYVSIPGKRAEDKALTVAKRLLVAVPLIAGNYYLYPHISSQMNRYPKITKAVFLVLPFVNLGPLNKVYRSFFFIQNLKAFHSNSKKLLNSSDWSNRFMYLAITYSALENAYFFFSDTVGLNEARALGSRHPIIISSPSTGSDAVIQALDDCGFTVGDYRNISQRFIVNPTNPKSFIKLKLEMIGIKTENDLVKLGIIDQDRNRSQTIRKLRAFMKNPTKPIQDTNNPPLTKISENARSIAAFFNVTLLVSSIALKLKYYPRTTLIGLACGALLSEKITQLIGLELDESTTNFIITINRTFQNKQSALRSPLSTAQRCNQLWFAWRWIANGIANPLTVGLIASVPQGQMLMSYL